MANFGETRVFGFKFKQIARPADDQAKNVGLDRLFIKIVRAQLDGTKRILPIRLPSRYNDFCCGRQFANGGECRETLGSLVGMRRQAEIDNRNRDDLPPNNGDGLLPGPGEIQPQLGENPFVLTPKPLVVFHDQQIVRNRGGVAHAADCTSSASSCTGIVQRMIVPDPLAEITSSSPPASRSISRI